MMTGKTTIMKLIVIGTTGTIRMTMIIMMTK